MLNDSVTQKKEKKRGMSCMIREQLRIQNHQVIRKNK